MTANEFRKLALGLPEVEESSHMDHPDFRVRKKIFATLAYPDELFAMIKLTPEQQGEVISSSPAVFEPIPGGWGLKGATQVNLEYATPEIVLPVLQIAWRNVAPKKLADSLN